MLMSTSAPRKMRDDIQLRRDLDRESDVALVRRVGAGDLSALGTLYDRHHGDLLRFVRRATLSASDAEDVTHETFRVLARIADRYDGRSSARPFLVGIASKLVLSRRRAAARFQEVVRVFADAVCERGVASPEGAASTAEDARLLERALLRLSPHKRLVVLMVDGEGFSGEEVAKALDIPLGTVWTRLHYGRAELRRALDMARGSGG
jgi:RNA polymerase sigma-70 factor (ECF subfamily)